MKHPFATAALLLLLLAAGATMRAPAQSVPEDYFKSAIAKQAQGDFDGAIADYTEVIKRDPANTLAYGNRAICKEMGGDWDGAIADFSRIIEIKPDAAAYYYRSVAEVKKGDLAAGLSDVERAIKLDPRLADSYANRAVIKQIKGDLDGAIADYGRTLALDPKNAKCYVSRGNVKQTTGDLKGALADFNSAVRIDPKYAVAWFNRASVEALMRNWKAALADFEQFDTLTAGGSVLLFKDYNHFYIWLMRARLGDTAAADQDLADYFNKRPAAAHGDWPSKLAAFLIGKLSQDDLLTAAASTDAAKDANQHCEAWFYIGMKALLAGDKKTAAADFRKSIATKRRNFFEYQLAKAELNEMGR